MKYFLKMVSIVIITAALITTPVVTAQAQTLADVTKPFTVTANNAKAARTAGWAKIQRDWAFKAWGQNLGFSVLGANSQVTFVKIAFNKRGGNGKEWYIHLDAVQNGSSWAITWRPCNTAGGSGCTWK